MIFQLQMLNSDATLNALFDIDVAKFLPGQALTLNMRILQPERQGLRYVPASGVTFSMDFKMSDDTIITKTPIVLDASDRSLVTVTLSTAETTLLISQNLTLEITEGATTHVAILQMALQATKIKGC